MKVIYTTDVALMKSTLDPSTCEFSNGISHEHVQATFTTYGFNEGASNRVAYALNLVYIQTCAYNI